MNINEHVAEEPFVDRVRRQAEAKAKEYYELQHEERRVAQSLERTRNYIDSLNAFLDAEGEPKVRLRDQMQASNVGKPGNRSKDMPLRYPKWEGMRLVDIVEKLLEEASGSLHADDVVAGIYELARPTDLRKAKHSLVSTLRKGVKDGNWEALGKNQYRSKSRAQQELQRVPT